MIVRTSAKSRLTRPGIGDQVGDPLDALAKYLVGHPEGVDDRRLLLDDLEQPVVRDDDQRVDLVAQLADAGLRLLGAPATLESERPRDDPDGQRAQLARDLGDDRSGAGAGAAALAGRDEDHVGALERLLQLVPGLHRGLVALLRVRARAEPARGCRADVDLLVGLDHEERLRVGVDRDELATAEAGLDHAVDGVRAAAAGADDLDHCQVIARLISHWNPLVTRPSLKLSLSVGMRVRPLAQVVKPYLQRNFAENSNPLVES